MFLFCPIQGFFLALIVQFNTWFLEPITQGKQRTDSLMKKLYIIKLFIALNGCIYDHFEVLLEHAFIERRKTLCNDPM